jgi:hypothetical protein
MLVKIDNLSTIRLRVNFGTRLGKLRCLVFESLPDRCFFADPLLRRVLPNVFRYFHTAEVGTIHAASSYAILLRCATARQEATTGRGNCAKKVMVFSDRLRDDVEPDKLAQP